MRNFMKCFFSVFVSLVMVLGLVPSNLLTAIAENNKTSYQDANIKYEKVTSLDSISSIDNYLIVSGNYALSSDSSSKFTTKIKINDDGTITDNSKNELGSSVKWNIINNGENYQIMNESAYLQLDSETFMSDNSNDELVLYFDGVSFAISGTTEDKSGKLNFLRYSKGFERHQNKYSEVINESGQIFKDSSKLDIYKEVIANNSDNNGEDTGENTYNVDVNFHLDGNKDDENSSTYAVKGGDNHNVIIPESYNDHTFDYMEIDGEKYNEAVTTIESVTKDTEVNYYYDAKEVSTEEQPIDAVHFTTTLYNYGKNINEGIDNNNSQVRFIGDGLSGSGTINTNIDTAVTQGIVNNTLNGGNIQFKSGQTNIFNKEDKGDDIRKVYTNVQFPFIYNSNDESYEFNSNKYHTHSNGESNETLNLYKGSQTIGGQGTFFPFNNHDNKGADYHFGMEMEVPFYMTEDGMIQTSSGKQKIKFEFSGDDDVWVFVDGKLLLDLGGIHAEQSGSINFADQIVTYNGSRRNTLGNTIASGSSTKTFAQISEEVGETISLETLADGNLHTLKIFYLERGAGKSNCKIKFNLIQKKTLEVSKSLKAGTPVTNKEFTFQVKKGDANYASKTYKVNNTVKQTDSEGKLKLKAGETALFLDPENGDYIISEVDAETYTKSWTTKVGNTTNSSTGDWSPTVTITEPTSTAGTSTKQAYKVACTNSSELAINDDTIVLDYGKAVKFNVTDNDYLQGTTSTIYGIGQYGSNTAESCENDEVDITYGNGTAELLKNELGGDEIQYTPDKYMSSIDKFTYAISYKTVGSDSSQVDSYAYGNVSIIPATTVYYEDNFGGVDSEGNKTGGIIFDKSIVSTEGTTQTGETQSSANTEYGNDSSYDNDSQDSNGSSTKITGNGKTAATFTFTGTGFDIVGRTAQNTGEILVRVYEGSDTTGNRISSEALNTQYQDGLLYQIPVYNYTCPKYGTYTVEIKVAKGEIFYLDGIRIYNPINIDGETEESIEAKDAYDEAKESNAQITEIRKILLGNGKFNEDGSGVVYVDGNNNSATITQYTNVGPNNEVYLKNGQSIGFTLSNLQNVETIQIGAKSPNGLSKIVAGSDSNGFTKELNTATDMYYTIYSNDNNSQNDYVTISDNKGKIVITNTGSNILSLTNIKVTYSVASSQTTSFIANEEVASYTKKVTLERLCNNKEAESKLNLKINKAKFNFSTVRLKEYATLKVYTSEDVNSIAIKDSDGNIVRPSSISVSIKESKGKVVEKIYTVKFKPSKRGKIIYSIYGEGKDGSTTSKPNNVKLTVL